MDVKARIDVRLALHGFIRRDLRVGCRLHENRDLHYGSDRLDPRGTRSVKCNRLYCPEPVTTLGDSKM